MNYSEIANFVSKLNSVEDIHAVNDQLRARFDQIQQSKKNTFAKDDRVYFQSSRGPVTGKIEKVLQKNIDVRSETDGRKWRVSPGLLTKV